MVGGGVVGLLVAHLCAGLQGAEVCLIDRDPPGRRTARALRVAFALPEAAPREADIVFHASASAAGCRSPCRSRADEGTIVELSWYGTDAVAAPLGLAFHARRLRLVASQVGAVAASRRPRWSHRRRLAKASTCCATTASTPSSPRRSRSTPCPPPPRLLAPGAPGLCTVIVY